MPFAWNSKNPLFIAPTTYRPLKTKVTQYFQALFKNKAFLQPILAMKQYAHKMYFLNSIKSSSMRQNESV